MGFNNLGPMVYLAEGQTAYWSYSFGGDEGTQFASADINPRDGGVTSQGVVHLADQQRKMLDFGGNFEYSDTGNAIYFVNITNQGPGGAYHNLQGGGLK